MIKVHVAHFNNHRVFRVLCSLSTHKSSSCELSLVSLEKETAMAPEAPLWHWPSQTHRRHVSSDFLMSATDGLCHATLIVIWKIHAVAQSDSLLLYNDTKDASDQNHTTIFELLWCVHYEYYTVIHVLCIPNTLCMNESSIARTQKLGNRDRLVKAREKTESATLWCRWVTNAHQAHSVVSFALGASSAWFAVLVFLLSELLWDVMLAHFMGEAVTV